MIGRLNHVAIAVPDIEAARATYAGVLGAQVSEPEVLSEHGVTSRHLHGALVVERVDQ